MWSLASGARSRCAAASPDAGDYIYAAYDFDDPGGGAVWQDLTCTHDDNGNLTSDGLHSYTYDAWNRLVAVAYDNAVAGDTDPTIATYVYDGLFRRISKTVSGARGGGIVYNSDADGSGIVARFRSEHYFYAGWRVVEVTNWDPSAFGAYDHTTADVLGQFVYGTQYVDEPVRYDRNLDVGTDDDCIEAGDASYYYHQDANYRVVAVTDEAGNVVERYDYTAYGDTLVLGGYDAAAGAELGNRRLTSVVGNPLQHQGLFRDRETGTYQNRFRQYHPRLGRFVQRDPLGYVDGMSEYEYLRSGPVVETDGSGQSTWGGCVTRAKVRAHELAGADDPIERTIRQELDEFLLVTGGSGNSFLDCMGQCIEDWNEKVHNALAVALGAAGGQQLIPGLCGKGWVPIYRKARPMALQKPQTTNWRNVFNALPPAVRRAIGGNRGWGGNALKWAGRVNVWLVISEGAIAAAIEVICAAECCTD